MESPPQPQDDQIDHFSPLNEDCLCEIFDRLPLDDLCKINDTCKTLRNVSINYFKRKYQREVSGIVEIRSREFGDFEFNKEWAYTFGHFVQSIRILNLPRSLNDHLAVFLNTYLGDSVKRIGFERFYLAPGLGKKIQNVLVNVETITIWIYYGQKKYLNDLLSSCPRLKHLKIYEIKDFPSNASIPVVKLPSLELFDFEYHSKVRADELEQFLRLNESIETVACHFYRSEDVDEFLQLAKTHTNIKYLFLDLAFGYHAGNFQKVFKALDEMAHVERLETLFWKKTFELGALIPLKARNGLHVYSGREVLPECTMEIQCELLKIHGATITQAWLDGLSHNIPNVRELYFVYCSFEIDSLSPLVRHSPTLSKVIVLDCSWSSENFQIDVRLLNEHRKELENGCKMTVLYCQSAYGNHSKFNLVNNTGEADLVKFKQVNVHHGYGGLHFNTENPLIRFAINEL